MNGKFSQEAVRGERTRLGFHPAFAWDRRYQIPAALEFKVGLGQPMRDEHLEMVLAADAQHVFLRGQDRVPGEDAEVVQPAVLNHQEPIGIQIGFGPTHSAWEAVWQTTVPERFIPHSTPLADRTGQEAWRPTVDQGHSEHFAFGIEAERVLSGAGLTKPEVLPMRSLAAVAVKRLAGVLGESFR